MVKDEENQNSPKAVSRRNILGAAVTAVCAAYLGNRASIDPNDAANKKVEKIRGKLINMLELLMEDCSKFDIVYRDKYKDDKESNVPSEMLCQIIKQIKSSSYVSANASIGKLEIKIAGLQEQANINQAELMRTAESTCQKLKEVRTLITNYYPVQVPLR